MCKCGVVIAERRVHTDLMNLPLHLAFLGRSRVWALALAAGLVLTGCTTMGGQTGGENANFGCIAVETTSLGLDEEAPIGFRAADVLDWAAEPRSLVLRYDDGTDTTLDLVVSSRSSVAQFEDREWRSSGGGGQEPAIGTECRDALVIPVTVQFASADGLFADEWSGSLVAEDASAATVTLRLEAGDFQGSFDLEGAAPEDFDTTTAGLDVTLTPEDGSGELEGYGEKTHGETVSLTRFAIATFGASADGLGNVEVEPACDEGTAPEATGSCDFLVRGTCFVDADVACACAGCSRGCLVLESYPAQIACESDVDPGPGGDEPVSD